MTESETHVVMNSGTSCFAVFGVAPTGTDFVAEVGTLLGWLGDDDEPTLAVLAGAQFGPYGVTVRSTDIEPTVTTTEEWEDVVEASVEVTDEPALGDVEDGMETELDLPPGGYRLRVSARGRTESAARERSFQDEDIEDEEPLEHFLLELWPAPAAASVVVRETSRFAYDTVSPPAPDWPAEREPGLEAARRLANDLRSPASPSRRSGRLGQVRLTKVVEGTRTRIFNRVKHANGWPPGNGGVLSLNERVGDRCSHYGDDPDGERGRPLLGLLETVVLDLDKPSRLVVSWNWEVAHPLGETRPRLLPEDSIVTMTFAKASGAGDDVTTRVEVHHAGVPVEWIDDLTLLWDWDVARFARRP